MYFNSGYLNNSRLDFKDYTCRLSGRKDGVTTGFCMWPPEKLTSGSTARRKLSHPVIWFFTSRKRFRNTFIM